ncbi:MULTISPECIES: aminoglycoside phosphotransferase family protein [unclassified Micromonospora]|uniref:aminoglycoside phosphotransferase family protein n=1 Tax=unclassified Micromonospora TaxID=2617518 RepID=UPI00098D1E63|nr:MULTISPECIES: aminoglycoside phosphotransferase family protein [unclassified Micromonospora]MDI5936656.1 aminoglycoside phosphotransferase family protein [Micromonospora sp. DH15]OON32465.1 hypothetical protein BSA16_05475 [Micromonospora sp. Rc5]
MDNTRMHTDEVVTDVALVGRLIAEQFPRWAALPVRPITSAGTDNAIYRLGDDLSVRLPRIEGAAGQIDLEHDHLPRLARHLPLEISAPLERGRPAAGYPFPWGVYRWLPGQDAHSTAPADPTAAARDLGAFVRALHASDPEGGPRSYRGEPLDSRDARTRENIGILRDLDDHTSATRGLDLDALLRVWRVAREAPAPEQVWIHGDLLPTNLLVDHGRVSAVIDFGCAGLGDPAWDALPAWALLTGPVRAVFRQAAGFDDGAWERGRGLAVSWALIALPYYRHTNRLLAGLARRTLDEVLGES